MPKITSPTATYGHMLHPEDKPHECFWCGDSVEGFNFDYTPAIEIMKNPIYRAEIDYQPYAVTCCLTCKKRMYPKRFELVTIERKRLYNQSRMMKTSAAALETIRSSKIHPWQRRSFDESGRPSGVIDIPDYELSDTEKMLKDEWMEKNKPAAFDPRKDLADFGD